MNEAVLLIGHGATAVDTPRALVAEFKRLESERAASRAARRSPREVELDGLIRRWPRTPDNDAYKAGVEAIARALAPKLAGRKLAVAYNEFCAPSVEDALEALIAEGVTRIGLISTMFTRGGLHAEREIPDIVREANRRHPSVRVEYAWPFDPDLVADFLATQLSRTLPPPGA